MPVIGTTWIGEGGFQAPAAETLIAKALGLWKYTVRGIQIPQAEINAIRRTIPSRTDENSGELYKYKGALRREIGEQTLSGKFRKIDSGERKAGVMIMWVLSENRKDARTLSAVCELSQIMNFTLGGYNLKEMTALVIRAEVWLEEMRGKRSENDIARRRRVEILKTDLLNFLGSTRLENFKTVENARRERAVRPLHEELRKLFTECRSLPKGTDDDFPAPSPEERIAEIWRFLKNSACPEIDEITTIYKTAIPKHEKSLRELELRRQKREKPELTKDEVGWKKQTEKDLAALWRRAEYLWSIFCQHRLAEMTAIISIKRESAEIGGVS